MMSQSKRKPLSPRVGAIPAEADPVTVYSQVYVLEAELDNIVEGDQVRHKLMDYLNMGLPLQVLATDRNMAFCGYTDDYSKAPVIVWYEKAELVLVSSASDDNEYRD